MLAWVYLGRPGDAVVSSAPTYDQLVAALDRIVRAHYAEADDDQGVTAVLREIEASIEAAADLAGRAYDGRSGASIARRLDGPTGQPPEPDRDTPPPAHARIGSDVPNMRRVT